MIGYSIIIKNDVHDEDVHIPAYKNKRLYLRSKNPNFKHQISAIYSMPIIKVAYYLDFPCQYPDKENQASSPGVQVELASLSSGCKL